MAFIDALAAKLEQRQQYTKEEVVLVFDNAAIHRT